MNDKLFTLTGVPVSQIMEKLAEPFDPQAYKGVPGGADLTDINTGYMIERATQIFGLRGLGWKLEYSPENLVFIGLGEGKRVTAHLKYAVFSYALVNEQGEICWYPIITGAANTNDFAYAEEGARTAAIGAALKSLCFQLPVYKGQLDHHNAGKLLGGGTQPGGNGNGAKPSGNGNGHGGTTFRSGNGNGAGIAPQRSPDQIQANEKRLQELGYDAPSQPGDAPNAHLGEDAGAYVIQYGKTYTGWTLRKMVEENPKGREAGLTALRWYANEMKPATENAHADQAAAKKFLAIIEAQLQPA
jgi:hypothetical protein